MTGPTDGGECLDIAVRMQFAGRHSEALAHARTGLDLHTSASASSRSIARGHLTLGGVLSGLGRTDEAIKEICAAINLLGDDAAGEPHKVAAKEELLAAKAMLGIAHWNAGQV
jgi:hypothetical protein